MCIDGLDCVQAWPAPLPEEISLGCQAIDAAFSGVSGPFLCENSQVPRMQEANSLVEIADEIMHDLCHAYDLSKAIVEQFTDLIWYMGAVASSAHRVGV